MSRRIDIELTSRRDENTWTWRAAGAREPKGTVAADRVPDPVSVGDVVRADADFLVDGIEILAVLAPKERSGKEPERLELLGTGGDETLVTTSLVSKRGSDRDRGGPGKRRGGGGRGGGGRGDARRGSGDADSRGRRAGGQRGERRERPATDKPPAKPKPKRLRPQRTHRQAVLDGLSDEQKPIAEQVLRGGVPAVRQALDEQNQRNKEQGNPEINPAPLIGMAERLLPSLKAAEWHDRADAALTGIDEVDIRDIRSVVVAADGGARGDEARQLAEQLRTGLAARVEREHAEWLKELAETLADGRTVRALRLSSRPPKAGAPLPTDLAARLTEAANTALAADAAQERWGIVLDAVAYSPVRTQVVPDAIPEKPGDALLETVRKIADRVPDIAARLGVQPAPRRRGRRRVPPPPPRPETDLPKPPTTPPVATASEEPPAAPAAPAPTASEEPPAAPPAPAPTASEEPPAAPAAPAPTASEEPPAAPPAPAPTASEEPPAAPPAPAPTASEEPPAAPPAPAPTASEEPPAAPPAPAPTASEEPPAAPPAPAPTASEEPPAAPPAPAPTASEEPPAAPSEQGGDDPVVGEELQ